MHQRHRAGADGRTCPDLRHCGACLAPAAATILPSVARDLDGLSLFGAAAAGPMVSYVVGVSIAGLWADRSGPVPVLATGIVGFTIVAGLAAVSPVTGMFVGVRLAAGVAKGSSTSASP